MKKKAIEKIPYFGLKKTSRKKDVKYIGVTAVKIVGHEKHLFLEVYRNKKRIKRNTDGADHAHKKGFRHILAGKGRMDEAENKAGQLLWPSDMGRRTSHMGAGEKRKYTPEHRGSGKDKEVLQSQRIQRGALVGIHI
jgi:hypothetical protein